MRNFCIIAVLLAGLVIAGLAQDERVQWSVKGPHKPVSAGEKFSAIIEANISHGWHMYSFTQPPGGPTTSRATLPPDKPFKAAGPITGPVPTRAFDPNFEMETESYEGRVVFQMPVEVMQNAIKGNAELAIDLRFQVCDETTCLPPKTVRVSIPVEIGAMVATSAGNAKSGPAASVKAAAPTPPLSDATQTISERETKVAIEPTQLESKPAESSETGGTGNGGLGVQGQSLGSFMWLAAVMGALSLLTPCVFPMIPITVSYFTNHSGANRRTAILTAMVYGLGIILTFTALGMLLAIVFGAGGVNQLAANPWVNLLITAIFLGFAFSLFGAYFIQVPPSLMNKLDAITRSKEGSGVVGALLMGFTFTLTSFTCTAPFVGTLLVMTAQGNWRWPLAGMLAFSTVFAIPFFVLALAPQLMSRLPKAGGWMVSVKVLMGFLEIAAAMKFLSNADLVWRWGIFTRQVVLAVWVGIGILMVLYILGYFRMEHDSPIEALGAVRVTAAITILATTIWLVPGLFGRQLGELESFLPPETGQSSRADQSARAAGPHDAADWVLNDYDGALATAKQENKLMFVDFTGYTCTNCRWMESNMFPRPEVAKELRKFVRVRLYTDGAGEVFERQQKMQQERFGTVALPYYAILRADGSSVAVFPGLTRDTAAFVKFLQCSGS